MQQDFVIQANTNEPKATKLTMATNVCFAFDTTFGYINVANRLVDMPTIYTNLIAKHKIKPFSLSHTYTQYYF